MTVAPAALNEPTTASPPRAAPSARRTSHVDMVFGQESAAPHLRLTGAARDIYTDVEGEALAVAEGSLDAELEQDKRLATLSTQPAEPATATLIGLTVGRGFRAALDQASWQRISSGDPLHLLLDDLPVAALISGYATLYSTGGEPNGVDSSLTPDKRDEARGLQSDICSGWRSDGTMMVSIRSGRGVPVTIGPAAPDLGYGDPWSWHTIGTLQQGAMRRRRLLDVSGTELLSVNAMFRDTHVGSDGMERVLHEYTLTASVDPATLEIVECRAQPRALPWPECPDAAASALRLLGVRVPDLHLFAQRELHGVSTCTHLNDLLRSLANVAPLARILREHEA